MPVVVAVFTAVVAVGASMGAAGDFIPAVEAGLEAGRPLHVRDMQAHAPLLHTVVAPAERTRHVQATNIPVPGTAR